MQVDQKDLKARVVNSAFAVILQMCGRDQRRGARVLEGGGGSVNCFGDGGECEC